MTALYIYKQEKFFFQINTVDFDRNILYAISFSIESRCELCE